MIFRKRYFHCTTTKIIFLKKKKYKNKNKYFFYEKIQILEPNKIRKYKNQIRKTRESRLQIIKMMTKIE